MRAGRTSATMPSGKFFSVRVVVGDEILPEYSHNGNCYVESSVRKKNSYTMIVEEEGCEEKQVGLLSAFKELFMNFSGGGWWWWQNIGGVTGF